MSGAPANIRVHSADDPRLPRTLRGRLEKRCADLMAAMIYATDWPDHQRRVGEFMGVKEAIDICSQIEKDLNG